MKFISIEIYTPEVKIKSNDFKKFRKYLADGYYSYAKEEGYWILRKNPKIMVTFENEDKEYTINLRSGLKKYYGKKDPEKWIKLFGSDIEAGKITLESDSVGYWSIVEK